MREGTLCGAASLLLLTLTNTMPPPVLDGAWSRARESDRGRKMEEGGESEPRMRRLPRHVSGKHEKQMSKTCRNPSCSIASFCMERVGGLFPV
jgi:hypothetical protein